MAIQTTWAATIEKDGMGETAWQHNRSGIAAVKTRSTTLSLSSRLEFWKKKVSIIPSEAGFPAHGPTFTTLALRWKKTTRRTRYVTTKQVETAVTVTGYTQ